MPIKLGIVGVGKIARDQHLPVIAADPAFDLVAAASKSGQPVDGVPTVPDIDTMLSEHPEIEAVTICTPPVDRHVLIRDALNRGLHVMLEKPPGATLSEIEDLPGLARAKNVALFATYHSRFAPAVAPARDWLKDKAVKAVRVRWLEDVRRWHPGQDWVFQPGGLGVFDPGINALSSLTAILPASPFITAAELFFPANRDTPIAATLAMTDDAGVAMDVRFDWRQTGEQTWEIDVDTDAGTLKLTGGGTGLDLAGQAVPLSDDPHAEYEGLYRRFAELVAGRQVDFDERPIELLADAFMLGKRTQVDAFEW
ncbi:MAG: Gfo/Idh/MocA family oxidoreductase [Sphingomonadaceae bacterium]|nr:Gfo/Idh/MocA family oxidoreductase [Sphingomonadaceae bacterium]